MSEGNHTIDLVLKSYIYMTCVCSCRHLYKFKEQADVDKYSTVFLAPRQLFGVLNLAVL